MALKAEVERLLSKITDQKAREEATKLYEAHPFMQEAVLAQEDYSRVIQEAKRKDQLAEEKYQANLKWFKDSSTQVAALEQERDRIAQERETLKSEVETLRTGRGGPPPAGADAAAEAAAGILAAKYEAKLTKLESDLTAAKAGALTQKAYEDDITQRGNNLYRYTLDVVEAKEKHMREFGRPLAESELSKYMSDNKMYSVSEAYDKMTADSRRTAWETQKEKDIEERILAKLSASNLPIGNGSPVQPKGPLQQWINKESAVPEGIVADGSGRLASIAAQELRSDGKF